MDRTADQNLIFACSGAADVGHITDLAARRLSDLGAGCLYCLAGIAAQTPAMLATARQATRLLVIDGCPESCARKALERAGFNKFSHLQLADLGLRRGSSPASPEHVEFVVQVALTKLG